MLWSDESAMTGLFQIPGESDLATTSDALLSGFTRHHVAYVNFPFKTVLTEAGQVARSAIEV